MKKILLILTLCCAIIGIANYAEAKKTQLAPSYAWKIVPPLGLREHATIDTVYENYSLEFIPQMVSPAYAATGNYCGSGKDMMFMQRRSPSSFFFNDAISPWIPSMSKAKFYNTRIPMTLLSYTFGGGKDASQDHFSTVFSANANSKIQVGGMLDYIYSKGSYNYQAAKNLNWGISGSYIGNRFEFQGYFTHFNLLQKENGGISDDRYITDPAVVQGGSTSVNAKQIPTNLTDAHNRVRGTDFYLNSRYKLGFWKEEQLNDSTVKRTLVPVTSFIWTMQYNDGVHKFRNINSEQNIKYWDNTYLNPGRTVDVQNYWKLTNTIGVSLLEGFNKYAKAGLSAYVTHELRDFKIDSESGSPSEEQVELMTPIPFPDMKKSETQNLMWIGAQLTKQKGRIINYNVTGEIGVMGDAAGEVKVTGELTSRIPLFGDTIPVRAFGHFTNLSAPWLMKHYWSNHFMWNNDFGKTRSVRFGGEISVPWTRTTLSAAFENVQNQLYFDENALPAQYGSSAQVFTASLQQDFKFGPVHWDNLITYQQCTEDAIIPLPKLVVNSNLYVKFRIATLFVQFGVNCDYFTKYKGVSYQPATMSFYNQRKVDIGNYPILNVYLNCKLSKTKFFIMMSHVNQGMTGKNYFSMPHYPINPRRLQMGLSIDFAN